MLQKSEEGSEPPGTRVKDGCESKRKKKKIVVSRCVGFRTELVFSAEASSPFDY